MCRGARVGGMVAFNHSCVYSVPFRDVTRGVGAGKLRKDEALSDPDAKIEKYS